jgi:hypothetical protein
MESIREVLDYEVDITLDTTYFGKYISPHKKALINKGKSLLDPQLWGSSTLPQTMKRSNLSPELCKTSQITPRAVLGRGLQQ